MQVESDRFYLRLADNRRVSLSKPSIMGIINMSPNSFYNPYHTKDQALTAVELMVKNGASFIDVGGEATNLSIDLSQGPSIQQQIDRIVPLVELVSKQFDVLISVDTSEPAVMREAIKHGAHMINDQRGLQVPGALSTLHELSVPVCLMHFFAKVRVAGSSSLSELLTTIKNDLHQVIARCQSAGIANDKIIIDPGFGQGNYGKNSQENFYLLAHLSELASWGYPVLAGWSRKSMIGDVLGVPPAQRLSGSIAAATLAAMHGAAIIRVHDVAETVDAIKIFRALRTYQIGSVI